MTYLKIAAALIAAAALYLLFWPTGMTPVAWTAPAAPPLEGPYAYNEKLRATQRLAEGVGTGPEALAIDATGALYTGYDDGRLILLAADASTYMVLEDTGGRPLGITFSPRGGLAVADGDKGLLHIGGDVRPLVAPGDPLAPRFVNDVDNTRLDRSVYFTDSSSKFGRRHSMRELLEHGGNGRLMRYDFSKKKAQVLLDGLHFANGVAVGPDDAYVLVCETGAYRVQRYWLKGPKAGTAEVFIDNLPGFPDNISFNDHDRFWLALVSPRSAQLDELLAGNAFARQVLARLPAALMRSGEPHAFVLGLDLDGKVVANLQYRGPDAYAPVTSVREHGPWLYFGSIRQAAIGRLPLNVAIPGAPAPAADWRELPRLREIERRRKRESEEREEAEREAVADEGR